MRDEQRNSNYDPASDGGRLRASSECDRRNSSERGGEGLQATRAFGDTKLADVAQGHWDTTTPAITNAASERNGEELSIQLKRVSKAVLDYAEELMNYPSDIRDDPRITSEKGKMSGIILSAQLKADENALRARREDLIAQAYADFLIFMDAGQVIDGDFILTHPETQTHNNVETLCLDIQDSA